MLVLRRKVGESIILDGVISVSVLAVEGERVKIGITAPPDVTIVREELLKTHQLLQQNFRRLQLNLSKASLHLASDVINLGRMSTVCDASCSGIASLSTQLNRCAF